MKKTETEKFMQRHSKAVARVFHECGEKEPTKLDKAIITHPACGLAMALDMDFDEDRLLELGYLLVAMFEHK